MVATKKLLYVLCLIFIVVFVNPVYVTLSDPTPKTGTFLSGPFIQDGSSFVELNNNNNKDDAVVILTDSGKKEPICSVFVGKGTSYTIKGIKNGKYNIFVVLGNSWDGQSNSFLDAEYYVLLDSETNAPKDYDLYSHESNTLLYKDGKLYQPPGKIPGGIKLNLRQIKMGSLDSRKLSESKFP